MIKIVVVEDDSELAHSLGEILRNGGYDTEIIKDFIDVPSQILKSDADLVLLDINIPNLSGDQVLRKVREKSQVPVVMLTGRDTEIDEAMSMSYGADDFITKPYNSQILLLRIEAVLKRCYKSHDDELKYQGIAILPAKSVLKYHDQEITLSKNELAIMTYLVKNHGKIVSRTDIMDHLWSDDQFVDDNTLTVNINRLRRKLTDAGIQNLIQTRRSQGYIIQ